MNESLVNPLAKLIVSLLLNRPGNRLPLAAESRADPRKGPPKDTVSVTDSPELMIPDMRALGVRFYGAILCKIKKKAKLPPTLESLSLLFLKLARSSLSL